MKLKIFVSYSLICSIILLFGCSRECEKGLLYLDYESDRVLIDGKTIDESQLTVYDKWHGLRLFFDCKKEQLWSTQNITRTHLQFNLIYHQQCSMETYEKQFTTDEYEYAVIKDIYDDVAVIETNENYVLYDILNDQQKSLKNNMSGFLGYNGSTLYFLTGYYTIESDDFIFYPGKIELKYHSKYFASDDIIASYDENNCIFIFHPKSGEKDTLGIHANSKAIDRESTYYYSNGKLYYSKRKIIPKDFLLFLFPVLGYYYASDWYEYDVLTKKGRRINTPSNYSVVIGSEK